MSIRRQKALFFLAPTTGGAERMTVLIGRMLPPELYDVTFVIVGAQQGTIVDFIPAQYPVRLLRLRSIYCLATLRMAAIIREERADVVFCSLHYINYRLIAAARLTRTRVVIRINIELGVTSRRHLGWIKLAYPWADHIIAQQDEMRDEALRLTRIDPRRIITLQNPIDVEQIMVKSQAPSPYPVGTEGPRYVCVARFSPQKGQDLLLKAFRLVVSRQPSALLYLVGKYDCADSYYIRQKAWVEAEGLSERVHFVGFDSNPYRWTRYADCYVMPSRFEGLPNALIEAMYLQRPVVATECLPVISRIVRNGYNGYVVPVEDAEAMAEAMIAALGLHDFEPTYQSASPDDFIRLFAYERE